MDTRLILQIVLGVIIALIMVLGIMMAIAFLGDTETDVVDEVVEQQPDEEDENPWGELGEEAITLVKDASVASSPDIGGDDWTVGELIEEPEFIEEELKLGNAEPKGWTAQWWGETRYGPSFYRVRYAFEDRGVTLGPTWLVDLNPDRQQVVPKNVYGQVVSDPEEGTDSEYFDQAEQVVSAIVNHRFPAEMNLGAALLLYFGGLDVVDSDDRVVGWTVDHSRQELFEAYFQWTDDDELVHAKFEFDFDDHALRPANLQANEIMRVGEEFDRGERVDVLPANYDPDEPVAARRWQGDAREDCRDPDNRDGCDALATILESEDLIETLEWTLTEQFESIDQFRQCRDPSGDGPPDCRWNPRPKDGDVFRIGYQFQLGGEQHEIAWDVHLDEERIEPVGPASELAYRAVRARGS